MSARTTLPYTNTNTNANTDTSREGGRFRTRGSRHCTPECFTLLSIIDTVDECTNHPALFAPPKCAWARARAWRGIGMGEGAGAGAGTGEGVGAWGVGSPTNKAKNHLNEPLPQERNHHHHHLRKRRRRPRSRCRRHCRSDETYLGQTRRRTVAEESIEVQQPPSWKRL